ncbi:nucleoside phosphorylase [Lysinibacillus telephonicus]|uniref:Uridine phosphorylase n=1 Tax=Lysinibacillus telephonicus TaxID=1714840 RepID=A0A431UUM1_9BACI|nr:nucleoside phosphorylase [Lysinibacillus telephonicus]RTQ94336.1 uridine phosphorylase [Lysinibacillus telephonicus]
MTIHLKGISSEDIGKVTLLVGDPGRVEIISQNLEKPRLILNNREFVLMNGFWNGQKVSICSTGIGVSSTEIAIIELIEQGAKILVRIGGCGAWKDDIKPGDIIINNAMARELGLLNAYAIDSFPAVADPLLIQSIMEKAVSSKFNTHFGIGLTSQSYYLGQDRKPRIKNGPNVNNLMNYWQERSILNCEMETAVIYMLASIYGIRAANCLVVHGNRLNNEWVPEEEYHNIHVKVTNIVLEACFDVLEKYN